MNTPSVGQEIDWTDDREVVLSRLEDATEHLGGHIWASLPPIGTYHLVGRSWLHARRHPIVVAFEAEHNPALSSKPAVGEVGEMPERPSRIGGDYRPHYNAYVAETHFTKLESLLSASRAETERLRGELAKAERGVAEAWRSANVSYQHTTCCVCLIDKHTPVRCDELGGYICGGCLEKAYFAELDRAEAAEALASRLQSEIALVWEQALREATRIQCVFCRDDAPSFWDGKMQPYDAGDVNPLPENLERRYIPNCGEMEGWAHKAKFGGYVGCNAGPIHNAILSLMPAQNERTQS